MINGKFERKHDVAGIELAGDERGERRIPLGLIVKYALRGGEVLLTVTGVADLADRFTDGWEEAGDSTEFK